MTLFNVNLLVRQLAALSFPVHKSGPLIQTVRWIKPRFKPIAKSKMFLVRKPTPVDPEEYKQLKFLNNAYSTHMRSLRHFFLMQLQEKIKQAEMVKKTDFSEDIQEFEQLLKENELWNEEVKQIREADMAKAQAEAELHQLRKKEKFERRKLNRILAAEEKILKEKNTIFILDENLDQEIEKVIDSRVDYNFAIDKQGNVIKNEMESLGDRKNQESEIDKS